jgi:hypothetical protein
MARTKGALNLRTQETMNRVQALCEDRGLDLFGVMLDIVQTGKLKGERKRLPPDQRLMILKEVTQYAFPKLSAMKHILDVGDNDLTIEWNQPELFPDEPIDGEIIN